MRNSQFEINFSKPGISQFVVDFMLICCRFFVPSLKVESV